MRFSNDYSFEKYMEMEKGQPNTERLFKMLTMTTRRFAGYSRDPFMSESMVSLLFSNHSLRNKFKKVLSQLRGEFY